ncbi:hypothetical protein KSZ_70680 [Dictyobacter formicarum]|uniref:Uncharacterized protein n=1 Tax=Dictyobacter formicarum TaxID=2778368 RepID=A0ABQ3VT58_9CHLR|nr:hypothetical protein KSZ_70680 [Dictyobacter formicarum]
MMGSVRAQIRQERSTDRKKRTYGLHEVGPYVIHDISTAFRRISDVPGLCGAHMRNGFIGVVISQKLSNLILLGAANKFILHNIISIPDP